MKNNLSEKLSKIFNPNVIVSFTPFKDGKKQNYQITLIEEDNYNKENSFTEITLQGFNDIYFAIKFDKFPFLHGRKDSIENFEDSLLIAENIRKSCDYIIWAKFEEHKIILLVELKSRNNDFVSEKFKSSKAFIEYLKSLLNEFYNFSTEDYKIIAFLINDKANKSISQVNGYFRKGFKEIKSPKLYYIKSDFEKILAK